MPSSSPTLQLNWPTMNLMSSSLLLEVNSFLKVSDPFPQKSQQWELLLGLSKLRRPSSPATTHLSPLQASRCEKCVANWPLASQPTL